MDESLKHQAQEWLDRGDHDIETAQLLHGQGGYTDIIAYHIQQAIEKYLKGYLIFKGQRPPCIHDLDALLALVDKFEIGLYSPFIELCEKASRYYLNGVKKLPVRSSIEVGAQVMIRPNNRLHRIADKSGAR